MQRVIILDFGSQTTQLIGRRVRELHTFCEILPYDKYPSDDSDVIGVILSGSPLSVYAPDAARPDLSGFLGRLPVLGICYGAQLLSYSLGGRVEPVGSREYGRAALSSIDSACPLFAGINAPSQVWMSHGDTITELPEGYRVTASTDSVRFAAFEAADAPVWGVQFHPEVMHTTEGARLLENFVVGICGSRREWTPDSFVESSVQELRAMLGDDRVVLGLSGGVDSSVAAVLLNRAIGANLTCIFVNHGLLRKHEFEDVMEDYKGLGLNVIGVDASEAFLSELAGESDPERKRKIIGRKFVEVFNAEASKIYGARWLA
jgi:GMP synthase (glutamine-hydrolysing)